MNFSALKQKIIFLKPEYNGNNTMSENIIGWFPFHPAADLTDKSLFVTSDNKIEFAGDIPEAVKMAFAVCGVRASVSPTTGREYDEAQKIREETTYKITTRYFKDIHSNMKILYKTQVFEIISVLDLGEEHRQLQLICALKE